MATQAVKQGNRVIRFRSAGAILRDLGMPEDGPHYRRLWDGFQRIFASTIYFGTEPDSTPKRVWDVERFHFFDRLRLWRKPVVALQDAEESNLIALSETFWHEIQEHPIPIKANVVRALLNNAGALDLYIWLSWRCFTAKGQESIPLFGPNGLANSWESRVTPVAGAFERDCAPSWDWFTYIGPTTQRAFARMPNT